MTEEVMENVGSEQPKMFLTPKDIEDVQDVPMEDYFVEAWNGWVTIRGLTGSSRDQWEESMTKTVGKGKNERRIRVYDDTRAKLLIRTLWNREKNKPLFDNTPANLRMLSGKSGIALSGAFDVACRLSGIGDDALDELEGNSSEDPGGGSPGE